MILTTTKETILALLKKQLDSCFIISEQENRIINTHIDEVLVACEANFTHSTNKYFSVENNGIISAKFSPYLSVQWMIFLYYMSHIIYKTKFSGELCDKIYYLNKIMHSVDLFYAIELPQIWSAEHPVGSVMGRAKYSNGFFFYQGCTVGGTKDKDGNIYYPVIEENVRMYSNSSILGNCHIGKGTQIGAGAIVKNQDVPAGSIVFGQSPNLIIKYSK